MSTVRSHSTTESGSFLSATSTGMAWRIWRANAMASCLNSTRPRTSFHRQQALELGFVSTVLTNLSRDSESKTGRSSQVRKTHLGVEER